MASALGAPAWTRWAGGIAAAILLLATGSRLVLGSDGSAAQPSAASKASPAALTETRSSPAESQKVATTAPEVQMVTLYSEPRGANVWHFSRFVGTTPLPLEVQQGKSLRVRVSMPGFETQTLDLGASEGSRVIKLERTRAQDRTAPPEGGALTQRERAHPTTRKARRPAPLQKPAEPEPQPQPAPYEKF
jgi:HSP20 family molecular chaperone IbpA